METEELRNHYIKCDEFAREAMKVFLEDFIPCRQLALMYVVDNTLHAKYYSIVVRETKVEDILGIISLTETELSREYGRQVLLDIDKMLIGLKWDKNTIQDYKKEIHRKMTREELRQRLDKRNELLSKCKRVIEVVDKDRNLIALCNNEDTATKFISYYGCDGTKIGDTRIILDENWCEAHNL